MVYEYRKYVTLPARQPVLIARFEQLTMGLFERHGFKSLGFWTPLTGNSKELHYILEWLNSEAREQGWTAFATDPEWIEAAAAEAREPLIDHVENQLWSAVPSLGSVSA